MKPNYFSIYLNAFKKSVNKLTELNFIDENKDLIKKNIFYGIKTIIHKSDPTNYEATLSDFELISSLKAMISTLTPNEFMNMFPVSKIYDGDRYETKDYYYTMDYINLMNKNEPIGDKALEFLMEYTNANINVFNLKGVMRASDLRQYDGHLDLMEEFMASEGVETPNTFKDNRGEPMYVRHGKPTKIEQLNHLQVVQ